MRNRMALLFFCFLVIQSLALSNVHAASLPFNASGQVLDRHGHPVQGANVTLYDGIYTVIGTTTSEGNGSFGFTDVIAINPGCKAKVTFEDGSNVYSNDRSGWGVWYPTDQGIITFNTTDTTLYDYPAPEYGYLWGILQSDGQNSHPLGHGVICVSSGDRVYYTFTDNAQNKGTFLLRLPVGLYQVWGQYQENGLVFQSKILDINVTGVSNYLDVNSIAISVPLSTAVSTGPIDMPFQSKQNAVSGFVCDQAGKPVKDQAVKLYQAKDDGSGYLEVGEIKTDNEGHFCFSNVCVTADAPDGGVIYGSKAFSLTVAPTDLQGQSVPLCRNFTLYNPDFYTNDPAADDLARNPVLNFTLQYSAQGWVKISTDTPGAKLSIDGMLVNGSDGRPVSLPYTAYLDPGRHLVRVTAPGYDDLSFPVDIVAGCQTEDVIVHLDRQQLPPWAPLAIMYLLVALVAIAAVALLLIFALAYFKR